jgi:uncharacterized protein YjiS (DUF1127 family)
MIMSTQRFHMTDYVHHGTAAETSQHAAWAMLDAIALPLRHMLTRFLRERALRCAEGELMRLDDRMLKDIGLNRSEVASAVRHPEQERLNGARHSVPYPH